MIQESRYWKAPLLRTATWLERLHINDASRERALVRLERELFVGFYAIRKLLDTFKVSSEIRSMNFMIRWSPCIQQVDFFNAHRIEELFDLTRTHVEQRDLPYLCNQFVHSYVFAPIENEAGSIMGVYVASDRLKSEKLYFVELNQILSAFRAVGRDYPQTLHLQRNERTNQWEEVPTSLEP